MAVIGPSPCARLIRRVGRAAEARRARGVLCYSVSALMGSYHMPRGPHLGKDTGIRGASTPAGENAGSFPKIENVRGGPRSTPLPYMRHCGRARSAVL